MKNYKTTEITEVGAVGANLDRDRKLTANYADERRWRETVGGGLSPDFQLPHLNRGINPLLQFSVHEISG